MVSPNPNYSQVGFGLVALMLWSVARCGTALNRPEAWASTFIMWTWCRWHLSKGKLFHCLTDSVVVINLQGVDLVFCAVFALDCLDWTDFAKGWTPSLGALSGLLWAFTLDSLWMHFLIFFAFFCGPRNTNIRIVHPHVGTGSRVFAYVSPISLFFTFFFRGCVQ